MQTPFPRANKTSMTHRAHSRGGMPAVPHCIQYCRLVKMFSSRRPDQRRAADLRPPRKLRQAAANPDGGRMAAVAIGVNACPAVGRPAEIEFSHVLSREDR